ncbi:MAG: nuclear transport factor 2 family protein [Ginsengibacter sp.]
MTTSNKEIIRIVNEGFLENDSEKILLYVADDVHWDMPGMFTHVGKDAFRKEINNDNFVGVPTITIKTEMAEGDYVAVEGEVQCKKKDGGVFDAVFCDTYRFENGKIKEMRSYVIEKK